MKKKSERNDLEDAFECEHDDEQVLDLFLKSSVRTPIVKDVPRGGRGRRSQTLSDGRPMRSDMRSALGGGGQSMWGAERRSVSHRLARIARSLAEASLFSRASPKIDAERSGACGQ